MDLIRSYWIIFKFFHINFYLSRVSDRIWDDHSWKLKIFDNKINTLTAKFLFNKYVPCPSLDNDHIHHRGVQLTQWQYAENIRSIFMELYSCRGWWISCGCFCGPHHVCLFVCFSTSYLLLFNIITPSILEKPS